MSDLKKKIVSGLCKLLKEVIRFIVDWVCIDICYLIYIYVVCNG